MVDGEVPTASNNNQKSPIRVRQVSEPYQEGSVTPNIG